MTINIILSVRPSEYHHKTLKTFTKDKILATLLTSDFAGNGMGFTELVTPIPSSYGHDGKLGEDDGTSDGSRHL